MSDSTPDREPSSDDTPPLPEGWRLAPADGLRTKSAGRILIGGAPLKIIRLSDQGAMLSRSWFAGEPISGKRQHQNLARRLLSAGMAHPVAEQTAGSSQEPITVVIPVKDDPTGLDNTLTGLLHGSSVRESSPPIRFVVVDDGSAQPVSVNHDRVKVLRNPTPAGPGGARQQALSHVTTPLVAFVDAGVVLTPADLERLVLAMTDPSLVAVAPRVLSSPQADLIGRYETLRSPLDLGQEPSLVGQGRGVPYVPTACVLVRADAVDQVGGFDPNLRYGEDVDLIWRLNRLGDVRYLPEVTVSHPPRATVSEMMRQRRGYGSAAAPLAARHGDAVAPCVVSPWSLLVTALVTTGHPVVGLGAAVSTGFALKPKLEPLPDLTTEAFQLTLRGHWYAGMSILNAVGRTWSPLVLAVAVLVPGMRKRMLGILGGAFARRLLDGPRQPAAAVTDVALGVVDDLSYASGVWGGAIRTRSARALLPLLTSWPRPPEDKP
jgi:mycofactocin system glycosyltransferase